MVRSCQAPSGTRMSDRGPHSQISSHFGGRYSISNSDLKVLWKEILLDKTLVRGQENTVVWLGIVC